MMRIVTIGSAAFRLAGRFAADDRGATAIEYSVVAAGIAVAVAATVFSLGTEIQTAFYNKLAQLF